MNDEISSISSNPIFYLRFVTLGSVIQNKVWDIAPTGQRNIDLACHLQICSFNRGGAGVKLVLGIFSLV